MLCDNVILIDIKYENFKLAYFQNIIQLKNVCILSECL